MVFWLSLSHNCLWQCVFVWDDNTNTKVIEVQESQLVSRLGYEPLDNEKDQKTFQENFSKLCFEFGIELDEVTSEFDKVAREKGADVAKKLKASTSRLYKIELPERQFFFFFGLFLSKKKKRNFDIDIDIHIYIYVYMKIKKYEYVYFVYGCACVGEKANRYDLLSVEGLTKALRIFQEKEQLPSYQTYSPKDPVVMRVTAATKKIRPYVVCAILRDIEFSEESLQSFIDLQEKLHFNICRKRTLCAIGTHDLDTLAPPFLYDARAPNDIRFIALKEEKEMTAKELFEAYRTRDICSLREYLPIIEHSPVYPIIYDSKGVVLSMPPIINSEHSKITIKTKNVFIESTCTDLTKANIALNILVTAFSEYCKKKFVVEQVKVVFDKNESHDEKNNEPSHYVTPDFNSHVFTTSPSYVNQLLGTTFQVDHIVKLLQRMSLNVRVKENESEAIEVWAPPSRGDILHPVDIVEDVAIAHGYNNLEKRLPEHQTLGSEQPLNALSDKIRDCVALCGFTEVLNWTLISKQESYDFMRIPDLGKAVEVEHPKTHEFQICRTNLLPVLLHNNDDFVFARGEEGRKRRDPTSVSTLHGVLKTLHANIGKCSLPLHLFEVGDIVILDEEKAVKARNERRLCALTCSARQSGFEQIHGLLDRVMQQNSFEFLSQSELKEKHNNRWPCEGKNIYGTRQMYYSIVPSEKLTFFPHRQAAILVDGLVAGYFGVVHPLVLSNFGIYNVNNVMVSAIELNLEPFLSQPQIISFLLQSTHFYQFYDTILICLCHVSINLNVPFTFRAGFLVKKGDKRTANFFLYK
ncbi:hypothetical protein RFI_07777 [Reticulomyxa filosa]|uniref:phenylalanine--tRNA ligase n=1 Tax=Reticulomyxa filosa TaxID=46433 RepID=X6NVN6_RETFI|nr:hypothetical protein RFI_07777 [Reticulomyxa filosa]|eukprot:ETO29347.1 hypothetical protein RFI_07777 [Reticulomyxa filosa]